jgi:hypothetical protein
MMAGSSDDRYRQYLFDLGLLLWEHAIEAKKQRDAQPAGEGRAYHTGELMAYHRVVSLMQQQAEAFGIPLADLRLEGVEPDRDLI